MFIETQLIQEDTKMTFRKTTVFILLFCMLLSAVTAAYAAGCRLKEAVSGSMKTIYLYNSNGTLAEERHTVDGVTEETVVYGYSSDHRLAEKTIQMEYGALLFHYDSNGTQIELENPGMGGDIFLMEDESISTERNSNGNVTKISIRSSYDGSKRVYTYTYDEAGRIKTFEMSGSRRDTFDYNGTGFTRTSFSLWDYTTTVRERYNAKGQLIESTDQYGYKSTYEYNADGRLTAKYMDEGEYYTYRYETDTYGNITRMTSSFSEGWTKVTEYRYEKVN